MRLLLFAQPRELLSSSEIDLPLPPLATLADARLALAAAHPELVPVLPACGFAVDEELVPRGAEAATRAPPLAALIPPVSGG